MAAFGTLARGAASELGTGGDAGCWVALPAAGAGVRSTDSAGEVGHRIVELGAGGGAMLRLPAPPSEMGADIGADMGAEGAAAGAASAGAAARDRAGGAATARGFELSVLSDSAALLPSSARKYQQRRPLRRSM
jgi:hypothetical protein